MLLPLDVGCRLNRRRAEPLLAVEKRSTLQQVERVELYVGSERIPDKNKIVTHGAAATQPKLL
jgi:hypothetical protein